MMKELSLNILNLAENAIRAQAQLIRIAITVNTEQDTMRITVDDDGHGMTEEEVELSQDPFYTTRPGRKMGMGVPFFKMAAEATGGTFSIQSWPEAGTHVEGNFVLSSLDRMPLGDIAAVIHTLIYFNPALDFVFTYRYNFKSFTVDTRDFRELLGDDFMSDDGAVEMLNLLTQNRLETDGGQLP